MLEALLASKKKDFGRSFCLQKTLNSWAPIHVPRQLQGGFEKALKDASRGLEKGFKGLREGELRRGFERALKRA